MNSHISTNSITELVNYVIELHNEGHDPEEIVQDILDDSELNSFLENLTDHQLKALVDERVAVHKKQLESDFRAEILTVKYNYNEKLEGKENQILAETMGFVEDSISSFLEDPKNEDHHHNKIPSLVNHAKSEVLKKLMEEKLFQKSFLEEMLSDVRKHLVNEKKRNNPDAKFYESIRSEIITELKKDKALMKQLSKDVITDLSKSMFSRDD